MKTFETFHAKSLAAQRYIQLQSGENIVSKTAEMIKDGYEVKFEERRIVFTKRTIQYTRVKYLEFA